MEKFFEGLSCEAEIKTRYKELAKKNHPDLGGDLEVMKEINAQYQKVLSGAYQLAGKSISEIEELLKNDIKVMETLNLIMGLSGIVVELCGCWVWVTGDTKLVKDKLKVAGLLWAGKKKAWYWRPAGSRKRFGGKFSLDDIRGKYGSSEMKGKRYAIV